MQLGAATVPRDPTTLRVVIADDRARTRGALRALLPDASVPRGGRPDALLNALGASQQSPA